MNTHVLVFDKLVYLDRLKSAGVPEEVARAHADGLDQALRESVATRADVERLERNLSAVDAKIDALEQRIDAKIDALEQRIDVKIDALEQRIDARTDALDAKINTVEQRLEARFDANTARLETKIAEAQVLTTRWMIGTFIALGGLFWAIVKYSH